MSDTDTTIELGDNPSPAEIAVAEKLIAEEQQLQHAEWSAQCAEITDCIDDAAVLKVASDAIESEEDGFKVKEGEAVMVSLEHLLLKYGQKVPAFEYYGTQRQKLRQTKYAAESIKETLGKVYRKIVEMLKRALDWLKNIFTGRSAAAAVLSAKEKKCEKILKEKTQTPNSESSDVLNDRRLFAILNIDGRVPTAEDLVRAYEKQSKQVSDIVGLLSDQAEAVIKSINDRVCTMFNSSSASSKENTQEYLDRLNAIISKKPSNWYTGVRPSAQNASGGEHADDICDLVFGQMAIYLPHKENRRIASIEPKPKAHLDNRPEDAKFTRPTIDEASKIFDQYLHNRDVFVRQIKSIAEKLSRDCKDLVKSLEWRISSAVENKDTHLENEFSGMLGYVKHVMNAHVVCLLKLIMHCDSVNAAILTYSGEAKL